MTQDKDGSIISQEDYVKTILEKFNMRDCNFVYTYVDCGVKLYKYNARIKIDVVYFKSLIGSLRYLTCTRPNILYGVGLFSRFMEDLWSSYLLAAKRILHCVKGTTKFSLFYSSDNNFNLVAYTNNDWTWSRCWWSEEYNRIYIFYGKYCIHLVVKEKQPIITLSTSEANM